MSCQHVPLADARQISAVPQKLPMCNDIICTLCILYHIRFADMIPLTDAQQISAVPQKLPMCNDIICTLCILYHIRFADMIPLTDAQQISAVPQKLPMCNDIICTLCILYHVISFLHNSPNIGILSFFQCLFSSVFFPIEQKCASHILAPFMPFRATHLCRAERGQFQLTSSYHKKTGGGNPLARLSYVSKYPLYIISDQSQFVSMISLRSCFLPTVCLPLHSTLLHSDRIFHKDGHIPPPIPYLSILQKPL